MFSYMVRFMGRAGASRQLGMGAPAALSLARQSRAEAIAWLRQHPMLRQPLVHSRGVLATGTRLDAFLHGGLPCGAITELFGHKSSGRTSLALHLAARLTCQRQLVAWIDSEDALDVPSLQAAGVVLSRFLWVRPKKHDVLVQALRAADVVVSAGGFAAVFVDLGDINRIPRAACWVRLERHVEGTAQALIVVGSLLSVGSMARVRLLCRRTSAGLLIEVHKARDVPLGAQMLLPLGEPVD